MPIKLNGSTSGYAQIQAGATAANNTLTLPDGNATLVDTSTAQTLTNKKLSSPQITGSTSGYTQIQAAAVAANNTLTLPSGNGNLISSADTGTVTQTMLGTNVAGNGPAFFAYLGADQTITASTFTKVTLNTKLFDTNTNFDAATNYRFTPTVAGYYQINWNMSSFNSTTLTRGFSCLFKNGFAYSYGADFTPGAGVGTSTGSQLVYMNGSTDYVELYAYITAATAKVSTVGTSTVYTSMSGSLVRSG